MPKPRTSDPVAAPLEPLLDALAEALVGRVMTYLQERDDAAAKVVAPPAAAGRIWLNSAQAAEQLGLSRKTLEAWRSRGEGPPSTRLGARVRYAADDLDRWARSRGLKRREAA
jgi:excisionase family DNA binding protein